MGRGMPWRPQHEDLYPPPRKLVLITGGAAEGSGLCFRVPLGSAQRQFQEAGSDGEAEWELGLPEYPQGVGRRETLADADLLALHSCRYSQLCWAIAPACLGSARAVLSDRPAGSEVAPQRC